jgi:hypothetical protein
MLGQTELLISTLFYGIWFPTKKIIIIIIILFLFFYIEVRGHFILVSKSKKK